MLSAWLRVVAYRLWLSSVVVLAVAAIALSVARALVPWLNAHKQAVVRYASELLERPLEVHSLQAHWHGLRPTVVLVNVTASSAVPARAWQLRMEKVGISIDLYRSLRHWRIEPARVNISGMVLTLPHAEAPSAAAGAVLPNLNQQIAVLQRINHMVLHRVLIGWPSAKKALTLHHVDWQRHVDNDTLSLSGHAKLNQQSSDFQLRADFSTEPATTDAFWGQVTAKIMNVGVVSALVPKAVAAKLTVKQIQGQALVWARWQGDTWQSVHTQLQTQNIHLAGALLVKPLQIRRLHFNALWQQTAQGWQLRTDRMQLQLLNQTTAFSGMRFQITHEVQQKHRHDTVLAQALPVALIERLRATVAPQLTKAWPSARAGRIDELIIAVDGEKQTQPVLQRVAAQFSDVKHLVHDRGRAASASGTVYWTAQGGALQLAARDVQLNDIPVPERMRAKMKLQQGRGIFLNPVNIDAISGHMQFLKSASGWSVGAPDLRVTLDDAILQASMLLKKKHAARVRMRLLAALPKISAQRALGLLPKGIFSPKFVDWLQRAVQTGQANDARFLLRGPLQDMPYTHHQGQFDIRYQATGLDLVYQEKWPVLKEVSAAVTFQRAAMHITQAKGRFYTAQVQLPEVSIPVIEHGVPAVLFLKGRAKGNAGEGLRYLKHSPLWRVLGNELREIKLNAPMDLNLTLMLPLEEDDKPATLNGHLALAPGVLTLVRYGVQLQALQGQLQFTRHSLKSSGLRGTLWGHPTAIALTDAKGKALQLQVDGALDGKGLSQLTGLSVTPLVSGQTPYQLRLTAPEGKDQPLILQLKSALKGLKIDLPKPFARQAKTQGPLLALRMVVAVGSKKQAHSARVSVHYGKQVQAQLHFDVTDTAMHFRQGVLQLGAEKAYKLLAGEGLQVVGHIPEVTVSQWEAVYRQMTKHSAAGPGHHVFPSYLRHINLSVDKADVFEHPLHAVTLKVVEAKPYWLMNISSREFSGQVWFPNQAAKEPLRINLQECHWKNMHSVSRRVTIEPQELPSFNLRCKHLYQGGRLLGDLKLKARHQSQGLAFAPLSLIAPEYHLTTTGLWRSGSAASTTLQGEASSRDVGRLLHRFGFSAALSSSKGTLKFQVAWPGSPFVAAVKKMAGSMKLRMEKGRLLDINPGVGRLLSILSLQSLKRRLQLDFGDLYKEGFSFDSIKGNLTLQQGKLQTSKVLIDGPAASIGLRGSVDLVKKSYNLWAEVKPNVAASLPLAAAIASGNPAVGAVVWLMDKVVVTREVKKVVRHQYRVLGSWQHPRVTSNDVSR